MSHIEQFAQLAEEIRERIEHANTEEAVKTSCVLPLFALLGYNIFNPCEFYPEYTCDVGTKKGEKVDYAVMLNDEPTILIECKHHSQELDRHINQLFRYFTTTNASFAILTDGITYKFFTDTVRQNIMDLQPFFEFNINSYRDYELTYLLHFHKKYFNKELIKDIILGIKSVQNTITQHEYRLAKNTADYSKLLQEQNQAHSFEIASLNNRIQSLQQELDKANESLHEFIAKEEAQKQFLDKISQGESDDLIQYLNMPVPPEWRNMTLSQRREYWLGDRSLWRGEMRNFLCTPDVACEFYGIDRDKLGVKTGRMTAKAIRNTHLFVQTGEKKRFPIHGNTLAWIRISSLTPNQLHFNTQHHKSTQQQITGTELLKRVREQLKNNK